MAKLKEQFYDFLIEEDELRACKAIPDDACTNVPKNFTLNIANGTLSKLAEKIISPNLTLAWIMDFFGASSAVIGALVPIKDAGSLLPQLAVSGKIRSFSIHKNFWAISALMQGLCWLAAAGHIFFGDEETFPIAMLVLLAIFSVASGVASVAYKDVIGKTIPKSTRGQMLSYRSTFGGILSLIAGVVLVFFIQGQADKSIYGFMFLFASGLWFIASILFFMIEEEKGATKGGRTPFEEVKAGIKLIKEEANFRNFLFTRALLMAVPLLQPFYVLVAKDIDNTSWSLLGYLIIVNGLANVLSSPFWGKVADQSATRLMRISSFIAIGGAVFALLFYYASDWNLGFYAFLPVFFINGIAYSGARLSRKTYLVDYAPDDNKATYVSVANTFIGLFTLVAAGFGVIAQLFGLPAQIIFFMSLLVLAIVLSFRLKRV
ncbi:MFS transporter [Marivirga tractuosa]|uniref:Major facilitator superfamily MFS_1 n=1 Tax=Marivirga tractuosa (strain ATCC 23168 / DSM 4126 / NBRC 15989 / NCIMB 1408 / VKM B-1430 / H-43) TaxID=643867 RepID=E4TTN9_MARTH|nr:MFS transporter [Marivirga tractuosa]ADR20956.1 major facilitator superfamily MFS_1 [Marivirga tractuosa DSM 4126]BDD14593.1 MFS transporter [Marivirga tractuosa]